MTTKFFYGITILLLFIESLVCLVMLVTSQGFVQVQLCVRMFLKCFWQLTFVMLCYVILNRVYLAKNDQNSNKNSCVFCFWLDNKHWFGLVTFCF